MKRFKLIFFPFLFFVTTNLIPAQENELHGSIKGKVIDGDTKQPLIGVNVFIPDLKIGATTDLDGTFSLPKVKVGSYTIAFSCIGYEKVLTADVIVRSERITFANAEMKPSTIDMNAIEVTAGYFNQVELQPISATSFSFEEIRRSPGAGGDVSRIIFGLPSLAKVNDTKNSLIVRGGSPVENGFLT